MASVAVETWESIVFFSTICYLFFFGLYTYIYHIISRASASLTVSPPPCAKGLGGSFYPPQNRKNGLFGKVKKKDILIDT
jgi:hypothetical protein